MSDRNESRPGRQPPHRASNAGEASGDAPRAHASALLDGLLAELGLMIFERTGDREFRLLSEPADWLAQFLGGPLVRGDRVDLFAASTFLDAFLNRPAEPDAPQPTHPAHSGLWMEEGREPSHPLCLEAVCMRLGDADLVLLKNEERTFRVQQPLFQKARENALIYHRMVQEAQEKEVLLHCIVHDLAGPLMGISSCLSWLAGEELSAQARKWLDTGDRATRRLETLIRDVLEVFQAEADQDRADDPADLATDISDCARSAVEILAPAASLRAIRLETALPSASEKIRVKADRSRLERVFYNLLENAIRHSPDSAVVRTSLLTLPDVVEVTVEDEGPGVPPSLERVLFRKFARAGKVGKVGLGLYFCRIVVERWGGRIGYRRREPGGSCFWFALPRPTRGT